MEIIGEAKREEYKEKLIMGAWIGYQMGAGGDKNFGDYLGHWGLLESSPKGDNKVVSAQDAIKKAESILEMARNKKTQ